MLETNKQTERCTPLNTPARSGFQAFLSLSASPFYRCGNQGSWRLGSSKPICQPRRDLDEKAFCLICYEWILLGGPLLASVDPAKKRALPSSLWPVTEGPRKAGGKTIREDSELKMSFQIVQPPGEGLRSRDMKSFAQCH